MNRTKLYALLSAGIIVCCSFTLPFPENQLANRELSEDKPAIDDPLEPYTEELSGSLVTFDMIPIPGGTVTVQTEEGEHEVEVEPVWMSATEVTWDLYDIFAYRLDIPEGERTKYADAKTRPSRPYEAPDYGYGHKGYAAICITYHAAEQFTVWLSEKTGRNYRLATEAEWLQAATAGGASTEAMTAEMLDEVAWYEANADDQAQPVASKKPNALGFYDMLGNVLEWVTGVDGKPVTRGGSFFDDVEDVQYDARAKQTRKWNETDPQIPKSKWWLSNGSFVGFRIVREP